MRGEPIKVTAKTRDSHAREMSEVAHALRRYLVRAKLIEDEEDPEWTVDSVFVLFADHNVVGREVEVIEAAVNVWTAYNSINNPREQMIATFSEIQGKLDEARALLARPEVSTYLHNVSRVGPIFGWQDEVPTPGAAHLQHNVAFFGRELTTVSDHASHIRGELVARRQAAFDAGYYGSKGGGPRPHFAYELYKRRFTYEEIAVIRGDLPPRSTVADERGWKDLVEEWTEKIRQEIVRVRRSIEAKS